MKTLIYNNIQDLIQNCDNYFESSKEIEKMFGGPSLYFHLQSIIEAKNNFLSDRHIEMIYATLASWGMHRMGPPDQTKTKLCYFIEFKNSILELKELFKNLVHVNLQIITEDELQNKLEESLKEIFYKLNVSVSNAHLVANSKTIHHIIPNLIPPIDRQYTFRFFYYEKSDFFTSSNKYRMINLPSDKDEQYSYFCEIVKCFKLILSNNFFNNRDYDELSFNTSATKLVDNLIMAYVKNSKVAQITG